MQIIKAQSEKFDIVKHITRDTISEIYPRYYARGVVDFFLEHHNDENIMKDIQDGVVYILYSGDVAIGTVTIKKNEICRLFVLSKYQHQGFGRKLLDFAEQLIAENHQEIILDSSLPAKNIYLKRGYVVIDSHTIVAENGDVLCYDLMKKNSNFLEETKYVDFSDPLISTMAAKLKEESTDEVSLIKNTYEYVRDEIHHSWDVQDKRVTVTASGVIREGVGICWAKANLLAALLRANGIPAGFSYQRLTLGDTVDTGYCIHGLNTVYVSSIGKWIRLDARGNKDGVNAKFSLDEEILAFKVCSEGEKDYYDNHAEPDKGLMKVLEETEDAIDMYLHHLPDHLCGD